MQINLITGISGSGKSVALRAFEDAGYDCVDNLPVTLLENLITTLENEKSERVAVAIDARRGQSIAELPQILENLRRNHQVRVVFLNADTNTLIQRFSETRRRHPLSGKTQQTQAATLIEAIDKELKVNPRNVQLQFVRARFNIEMGNIPAAKNALLEITQQFPELPEPYNNLAVLEAQTGNLEEAKDYLELALKVQPSFATAHENLGDVYTRLAARAYGKALSIDRKQIQNRRKMKLAEDILKPVN